MQKRKRFKRRHWRSSRGRWRHVVSPWNCAAYSPSYRWFGWSLFWLAQSPPLCHRRSRPRQWRITRVRLCTVWAIHSIDNQHHYHHLLLIVEYCDDDGDVRPRMIVSNPHHCDTCKLDNEARMSFVRGNGNSGMRMCLIQSPHSVCHQWPPSSVLSMNSQSAWNWWHRRYL